MLICRCYVVALCCGGLWDWRARWLYDCRPSVIYRKCKPTVSVISPPAGPNTSKVISVATRICFFMNFGETRVCLVRYSLCEIGRHDGGKSFGTF